MFDSAIAYLSSAKPQHKCWMHDKGATLKRRVLAWLCASKSMPSKQPLLGEPRLVCENVSVQSSKARRWENVILEPTVKGFKLTQKYCKTTSWLILKAKQTSSCTTTAACTLLILLERYARMCVCVQQRAEDIFRHRKKGFCFCNVYTYNLDSSLLLLHQTVFDINCI